MSQQNLQNKDSGDNKVKFTDVDPPVDDMDIDLSDFYGSPSDSDTIDIEDEPKKKGGDAVGQSMNPEIQAELETTRQRLADLEREREAEREEIAGRVNKEREEKLFFQKAFVEGRLASNKEQIKTTERLLIKAKEEGKTEDEVRLEGELSRLRSEEVEIAKAHDAIKNAKPENFDGSSVKTAKETQQNKPKEPPQAVKDWLAKNAWFVSPQTETDFRKKGIAEFLYNEVKREGKLRDDSPDFYNEVSRRLKMKEDGESKGSNGTGAPKKSPVSSVNSSGYDPASGKTAVKLDKDDMRIMKALKLDPRVKEHVQEFAREKAKVARRWAEDEE